MFLFHSPIFLKEIKFRMYYQVKLKWKEPKEGTDEMKKITKNFLVYAESVTEAELRMQQWTPANYQDANVEEVKQTPYGEIKIQGATETFWAVKYMDDNDGRSKPTPFVCVVNAITAEEAISRSKSCSTLGDVEEVKKYKGVVDEDLISTSIPARVLTPLAKDDTTGID